VRTRHPRLKEHTDALLDVFWVHWERFGQGASPTPRDAIYAFDLALSLADFEAVGGLAGTGGNGDQFRLDGFRLAETVHAKHLERALRELFGQRKESSK